MLIDIGDLTRRPPTYKTKNRQIGSVVVAQWVERLLPTPEICGLNPVIGNFIYFLFNKLNGKDKKEKSGREWTYLKNRRITF